MKWDENFVNAKYHFAVAGRMLVSYDEVGDKRFLVGVINEAARAVRFLIRAFVKDSRGNVKDILVKYVDNETCENLFRVLEVEKAQRDSPIEYAKGDKIILLIRGRYRILTAERIKEFMKSVENGIHVFSGNLRQV
jgi:hypothetical protein